MNSQYFKLRFAYILSKNIQNLLVVKNETVFIFHFIEIYIKWHLFYVLYVFMYYSIEKSLEM